VYATVLRGLSADMSTVDAHVSGDGHDARSSLKSLNTITAMQQFAYLCKLALKIAHSF